MSTITKQCKKCIMDNVNDPDLVLDSNGICNHCKNYDLAIAKIPQGDKAKEHFAQTIAKIKADGAGKKYDAILGISGGVDSTYLAYLAKENGLKLLLTHCDNGWDSELSVDNINHLCQATGYDYVANVLDWEEFKDIQLAFFKAGVVDLELPYDYALIVTTQMAAVRFDVKYVLTGHNVVTEGTYLPKKWRHDKHDIVNIIDIHKKFGKLKMKNFPHYSLLKQRMIDKKLTYLQLLNYSDYNKTEVKKLIMDKLGWRDYGGKHYESIFTRFYQGYILKEKFGYDKRQFHLSTLIHSKQISREEALTEYKLPAYDPLLLAQDKDYVIKKLEFTEESFQAYMNAPVHKHTEYKSIQGYWDIYFKAISLLKSFKRK